MAAGKKVKKITPYRNYSWLNIGTLLFGAIFVYMIITVFMYMTAKHITIYEVPSGSISGNYRYTALALKDEEIVTADYSGYVTYYSRNGSRIGAGSTVCSINESNQTNTTPAENVAMTNEDYSELRTMLSTFALNYSDSSFQDVHQMKADLNSFMMQLQQASDVPDGLMNQVPAPSSGFVCYTIDGMEGLTEDALSSDLFNRTEYNTDNLRYNSKVKMGDRLYKLVKGEEWYLYFPISSDMARQLTDRTTIRFRFLKDDATFSSAFGIVEKDHNYYGRITLRNSLVRYVSDRYLEIELLIDSRVGLKVPLTSLTEKQFYKIPQEYAIVNENSSGEITLLRETFKKDGASSTSYITATVYSKQDNCYLVAKELFKLGDYVQLTDTNKKHMIVEDDLATIQGVYNINKGYAVFRQVTVEDANEEFCIVTPYNVNGLAAHDFIALDASTVTDDDIVY